jgi:flagellar basal body-associated protein FliL
LFQRKHNNTYFCIEFVVTLTTPKKKNTMYLKLMILATILIGIAVAGIAIKMFFFKGGEFKKQCSSVDASGRKMGCSCGHGESSCENKVADHEH